jgi:hypothetical protein
LEAGLLGSTWSLLESNKLSAWKARNQLETFCTSA